MTKILHVSSIHCKNSVILNGVAWGPMDTSVHGVSEVKDLLLKLHRVPQNRMSHVSILRPGCIATIAQA